MTPDNSNPVSDQDAGGWGDWVANLRRPVAGGEVAWRNSGMDRLSLDAAGKGLDPVGPFVGRLQTAALQGPVTVDALDLLAERARITGLRGRRAANGGTVEVAQSVGGTAWILRAADGWFCVNLARIEDAAALPALVQSEVDHRDWGTVLAAFRECDVAGLDERAALLGMPASRVPASPLGSGPVDDPQVLARHGRELLQPFVITDIGAARPIDRPLVVDMTSLWAGPLCGALLAEAGCRVVKVEGVGRPDGARAGPVEFFDRLNAGKETVALDFADTADMETLRELLISADVVLEGSRPRVMDRLGVDPYDLVERTRNCWISITAHGRTGPWSNRVGFGDDVAASAGVVSNSRRPAGLGPAGLGPAGLGPAGLGPAGLGPAPRFVGDALGDPVGALYAAASAWRCITSRRAAVIDIALREALAFAWGNTTLREL